jgi:hypothetical protein
MIYIDDAMNLMLETMLWYGVDPNNILRELIDNCMHVLLGHSKCYNGLVQMLMLLIYHLILKLDPHLTLRI